MPDSFSPFYWDSVLGRFSLDVWPLPASHIDLAFLYLVATLAYENIMNKTPV